MNFVARIVNGEFDKVRARQKTDENIEMGDLLVAEGDGWKNILQVYDLMYGSQIPDKEKNLVAGMKLEGYGQDLDFTDPELSNYVIADLKSLVSIDKDGEKEKSHSPKKLPEFFSGLRRAKKQDFNFLQAHEDPLLIGKVRSGSQELNVEINLPGEEVLRHHILIPASTGKGKSNLVKVMSWNLLDREYCGQLIIDPHDEYYGTPGKPGLSSNPNKEFLEAYTPSKPDSGVNKLVININELKPWDIIKVLDLSEAQIEGINAYYQRQGETWINELMISDTPIQGVQEVTLETLKRKISVYLDIHVANNELACKGIFSDQAGKSTIEDIIRQLENSKTVILDTSNLEARVELLVGSIIANRLFKRYKKYKSEDKLKQKPVVSIVLEEAPRVIGNNSIMQSGNIFEKIAREGRKFKIGLTAITQLPSVIPREILANMNTKIILGMEMRSERKSIIESASQDISKDKRNIASLDKGEAIATSTFTDFAVPIKIPYFNDLIEENEQEEEQLSFRGIT